MSTNFRKKTKTNLSKHFFIINIRSIIFVIIIGTLILNFINIEICSIIYQQLFSCIQKIRIFVIYSGWKIYIFVYFSLLSWYQVRIPDLSDCHFCCTYKSSPFSVDLQCFLCYTIMNIRPLFRCLKQHIGAKGIQLWCTVSEGHITTIVKQWHFIYYYLLQLL